MYRLENSYIFYTGTHYLYFQFWWYITPLHSYYDALLLRISLAFSPLLIHFKVQTHLLKVSPSAPFNSRSVSLLSIWFKLILFPPHLFFALQCVSQPNIIWGPPFYAYRYWEGRSGWLVDPRPLSAQEILREGGSSGGSKLPSTPHR